MASPACMSDDGRDAVFVGTMLQTGDAVALCDECLVPWSAALLQALTGVDPTPFLRAVSDSEVTVEEVEAAEAAAADDANDAEAPPTPPRKGPGRTSTASRAAGTDDAPGETPSGPNGTAVIPAA